MPMLSASFGVSDELITKLASPCPDNLEYANIASMYKGEDETRSNNNRYSLPINYSEYILMAITVWKRTRATLHRVSLAVTQYHVYLRFYTI